MGPERSVASGEQGVFARVPTEKMRGFHVLAMMFASGPYFVEQEAAWRLDRAVKIVGDAAFLAAGWGDEGAEFGFKERFLPGFGAEGYDQGYGVFWELGG
jgi:hypothetical protein